MHAVGRVINFRNCMAKKKKLIMQLDSAMASWLVASGCAALLAVSAGAIDSADARDAPREAQYWWRYQDSDCGETPCMHMH
jgi:hypothetical protein